VGGVVASSNKLTLSVDKEIIERARRYSRAHGTSISKLVSEYLASLPQERPVSSPVVGRLRGLLPPEVSPDEYRERIEEKYGS
jgi:hypothetical protein